MHVALTVTRWQESWQAKGAEPPSASTGPMHTLWPLTHSYDWYTAPLWHDNSMQWRATKLPPQLKRGQLYFVSRKRESKGLWVDKEPESIAGRSINWLMNHSSLLANQKWLHYSGPCFLHLPPLNREPVSDSNPSKGQQEVSPTNQEVHLSQKVPGQYESRRHMSLWVWLRPLPVTDINWCVLVVSGVSDSTITMLTYAVCPYRGETMLLIWS